MGTRYVRQGATPSEPRPAPLLVTTNRPAAHLGEHARWGIEVHPIEEFAQP